MRRSCEPRHSPTFTVNHVSYPHELETVRPRLWRSRSNKVIAGVVGGLPEKLGIDPTVARVIFVAFSIFSAGFPGTIVYILLWAITKQHDVVPYSPRER